MKTSLQRLVTGGLALAAGWVFSASAGDWPQWRGPSRTGHTAPASPSINALPKDLKALWKHPAGGGHSSPIVAGGKVIFLDEAGGKEVAHALDAATGDELWSVAYANKFEDEWGPGPRSTPIADGDRLYVQSCDGEFRCLALADGKTIWRTNFKDFGIKFLGAKANEGTAARRGNNGCGVIDGDRIVVPVGSPDGASLVAFNKLTGAVLWKSQNDEAAYSSFMTATLAGKPQIVAFTADALLGVDRQDGKLLWRVPLITNAKRHAATPIIFGDTVIVNSHTLGIVAFKITKDGDGFKAAQSWANTEQKINLATPAQVGDYLYCQGANKDYVCVDARGGALKWSQPGFGSGKKDYSSTIVNGQNLLVLAEDGQLILLAANPEKYTELARLQVCGNTWSFPALADGKIYVRDGRAITCIDLLAK